MTTSDDLLLPQLRAGNPAAFETLVRQTSPRLLALARRFLRNDEEAQDALQEAYLSAYKALPRFEAKSSLFSWLHAITARAALMRLRKRRAHPETSIDSLLPAFLPNGHLQNPSPAWSNGPAAASESEEKALIRAAIDKLPEDYRNVLLLRDIEELDTHQTADLLGETEGVVKTRLHRARQALRTLLDPYFRKP